MLDAIKNLADTITGDQALVIQKVLGQSYGSFHLLMLSETEEEASERLGKFKSKVKKIPIPKLLQLHGELTDEQRSILEDLL